MRNDSSLTYNTQHSKVQNFKDFESNIRKEKDELKKIKRNYKTNKDGSYNLANTDSDKLKYNKITHKTDNNFGKDLVSDFIEEMEDEVKDTNHKYKLEKTQDKVKMESYVEFVQNQMNVPQMDSNMDNMEDSFIGNEDVTSYMFFGNLKTIYRLSNEILGMDENKVDEILNQGHNWAEDHITSAKVQISQVLNFLMNKPTSQVKPTPLPLIEGHQGNYMFFANLENLMKQSEQLLLLDEQMVDDVLMDGHDWAEDHISSAKENVEQVHDFLKNTLM
jgi:hypothetical protein